MRDRARELGFGVMIGCMVGTSLSMAPAVLLGQDADYVDLDGPLLLARDRQPGARLRRQHGFTALRRPLGLKFVNENKRTSPFRAQATRPIKRRNGYRETIMDLGLKGRKAIVCAASRGLGKGCAVALAEEGVDLVINGRNPEVTNATADELRAHGVEVTGHSRRHLRSGGPGRNHRRLPGPGYPGQQQCRPEAARFPRTGPRRQF
jgi:hypothetical protein